MQHISGIMHTPHSLLMIPGMMPECSRLQLFLPDTSVSIMTFIQMYPQWSAENKSSISRRNHDIKKYTSEGNLRLGKLDFEAYPRECSTFGIMWINDAEIGVRKSERYINFNQRMKMNMKIAMTSESSY